MAIIRCVTIKVLLVAQAPRRRLAALPSNAHNKQKTRRVWKRKGGDVCGLKVFCCWHFGRGCA